MFKEIEFQDQKGYGLAVTNPGTGSRALVGIFETRQEAERVGKERAARGTVAYPRVVEWNQRNYEKYEYVFAK